MKRFLTILSFALTIATMATAQTNTIKGVLTDSISGETEPYATVRVYQGNETEKTVAMSVTDADGRINQEVEGSGLFTITFSAVGKNMVTRQLNLNGSVIDLGTVYVTDDSKMLQGVEVVAHKTLVKMETDKMSYSVADDTESKSATVLDMLRKVPMVTVDGQDNITVNGASSFKVYVDGKPNVMMSSNPSQVFKSMPASVVKSIEVVTNPGAKYDAEGAGGVLNIIMNKQNPMAQESLNGYTATAQLGVSTRGVGAGLFANAQQGKLSIGVNGFYNYMNNKGTEVEMTREQYSDMGTMTTKYYQKGDTKIPFMMGSLNFGYDFDPMNSLNATFSINQFNMKNTGHPTTTMSGGFYGDGFTYGNEMMSKNKRTSFTATTDYSRFFNEEHTKLLTLTYQFSYSPIKGENETIFDPIDNGDGTPIDIMTNRYTDNREKSTEHTIQVDYTTPLSATQTLNTGLKYLNRRNSSDSKYYLNDEYNDAMSMDYLYKNNILAGYAELESKWGQKWSTKAGLRYEHTWQDVEYKKGNGEDFSKDYGTFVPSASLSYSLAPTQNIGMTYNMRISRPGITYLNPYIDRSSPTMLSYGNPDLDVEKTHNVQMVYNTFSQKFMMNATLRYSFCDNAIEQYSFYDKDNLLNTTYGNMMKRHQLGLNLYANYSLTTTTRLMLNGGITYVDMKSPSLDTSNNGWQGNMMVGLQQKLPWDMNLSMNWIGNTKSYTLQGWTSGFNMLIGTLSKSFLNDKINVSLSGVTGLSKGGKLHLDTYSEGKDFISNQAIGVNISQVQLTVSIKLGKGKQQMRMRQSKVTDDFIEHQSSEEQINGQGGMGGGMQGGGAQGGMGGGF